MAAKNILIVDDEEDVLTVLEKRLTVSGYSVIKAKNGNEAIRLAKDKLPNLILLDIMMPGMDGTEVRRLLKEDPATKNIPVLFLTCLFTKGDASREGHEIANNFFIAKPYNPEELLREVKKHLEP